jgi:hypothetical protein
MATVLLDKHERTCSSALSASTPGLCLRIPRRAFTLDGFRTWVKSEDPGRATRCGVAEA